MPILVQDSEKQLIISRSKARNLQEVYPCLDVCIYFFGSKDQRDCQQICAQVKKMLSVIIRLYDDALMSYNIDSQELEFVSNMYCLPAEDKTETGRSCHFPQNALRMATFQLPCPRAFMSHWFGRLASSSPPVMWAQALFL